jgi:hypothetical protein
MPNPPRGKTGNKTPGDSENKALGQTGNNTQGEGYNTVTKPRVPHI